MKFSVIKAGALLAAGLFCLTTDSAAAQAKPAVSNVALIEASGQLTNKKPVSDDVEEQAKKNPMAWAGIGLKVGVGSIGAASFSYKGVHTSVPARMGVHAALPIHLGGDGASWLFEPYVMQSKIGIDVKGSSGSVVGTEDVDLTALGMYMGPTFNIHATNNLYVGFGFGIKGAYIMNDAFQLGADAYGRLPVHGTYYINKSLALTAEVGFGYGVSAFASKPDAVNITATPGTTVESVKEEVQNSVLDNIKFGTAMTWDATIGVRLP